MCDKNTVCYEEPSYLGFLKCESSSTYGDTLLCQEYTLIYPAQLHAMQLAINETTSQFAV